MADSRPVRTLWLVLFPLCAGLVIGLLAGRLWAHEIELRWMQANHAAAWRVQRTFHSEAWKRDSLRWDSIRREPLPVVPREVARLQVYRDCVVVFEFQEAMRFQAFDSDARGRAGELLGRGVAFSPTGFAAGDRVAVAFPDVECQDIGSLSRGGHLGPAQVDSLVHRRR